MKKKPAKQSDVHITSLEIPPHPPPLESDILCNVFYVALSDSKLVLNSESHEQQLNE
jgi:hypothetical protein